MEEPERDSHMTPQSPATLLRATPACACDSHIHIYDQSFPAYSDNPFDFPVDRYREMQKRIGTTRTVVVSPRPYATDHSCTLDAITQLGAHNTRGIAVVHPTVSDSELKRLTDAGIRGIRFTLGGKDAVTSIDMIEPLSKRIEPLGWHVQIHMPPDALVENAALFQRLASPLVLDHMARIPQPAGVDHPAFAVIRRLLDQGRTWVKLSGPFHDSKAGSPVYGDVAKVAQAYIKAAPERLVWGSDWPHPGKKEPLDDVLLFNLLTQWTPDEVTRERILVTNPEVLYSFPKVGVNTLI